MDTDDYFWMPTNPPYTVKREKEKRIRLMREETANYLPFLPVFEKNDNT